jgi:hypothetical protein
MTTSGIAMTMRFSLFLILSLFLFIAAPASAACNPGRNQVAFYQHTDFKGACVVLGVGRYANSREMGIKNDSISSAKLGPGVWAVSYQDSGFKGLSHRHERSESSFPRVTEGYPVPYSHNDLISSVEVMQISTAVSGPAPVATYLGQHPSDRSNGWSNKLQGVGHDNSNWFFTQVKQLWKFPVSFDLNRFVKNPLPAGVMRAPIPKELREVGYNHLGDLVHHKGYLFIPLEAGLVYQPPNVTTRPVDNRKNPLMAVYRAADLSFVGSTPLHKQDKAGWLAINPIDGILYSSENNMSNLDKLISYRIDYAALNHGRVDGLKFLGMKPLFDEQGREITLKPWMQGGEFSDDGKFLFLVNGNQSGKTKPRDGGIWIFDFESGKKLLKSKGSMPFKFEYHPGAPNLEEPEGITYWNLGNGDAPNIEGNLHVILFNHDVTSNDSFWFKHYRIGEIKTLPKRCERGSIATCGKHGAECAVVRGTDGLSTDVCVWPEKNSVAACKSTPGIWTTPNSKYAKNHPDIVARGTRGTCASEVKNLRNRKYDEETVTALHDVFLQNGGSLPVYQMQTTAKDGLLAPSDVTLTNVTNSSLTLSWTDNATTEYGVWVERISPVTDHDGTKSQWEHVFNVEERVDSRVKGTGVRSDGDDGLNPDTEYCYRLRAYYLKEVSAYSRAICTRTEP